MPLSRIQTTLFSGETSDSVLRTLLAPSAPTNVTAAVGNTQAVVSWTAPAIVVPPVTDYAVQFSTNGGATWTTATDAVSVATTATITGLTNGTAHVFRVAAVNGIGTWDYSTASSAVTPTAGDLYFSSVALLLHSDGSGSTFVDSSPTPKIITAINATQSETQSKWGGKSLLIDSPSKYLSLSSSGFTLAGDFVMECWVYMTGSASSYVLIEGRNDTNAYQDFVWYLNNGGYNGLVVAPSYARLDGTTALVPQNQWTHIAIVRSNGVISAYVNGIRDATTVNYSGAITPAASTLRIGSNGTNAFSGYIDDMRITVGSNRGYTGATITVPIASFPDAGIYTDPLMDKVSLLLHADGSGSTFVDSSLTPKTITATNATQSATQSKFGGQSAYFDGSGDYLTVPSSAAFGFGTGDFTLEYWWYPTRNVGNETIIDTRPGDTANPLVLGKAADGAVRCYDGSSIRTGGTMNLNDWNHVAWSRSGGDNSIYLNGTRVINFANAFDAGSDRGLTIGANASVGFENAQGYIDDLRITKAARYNGATITVPTAAFTDS